MRRVLIGHDTLGRSTIAADEEIAALHIPGAGELYRLWSADGPATYPNDGLEQKSADGLPAIGAIRYSICDFPPGIVNPGAVDSGGDDKTGITWHAEDAGMHQTDTTDIDIVLSGEMTLDLETGSVRLRRGDSVVLGGARHRWRNEGRETASVIFFMTGAHHRRT